MPTESLCTDAPAYSSAPAPAVSARATLRRFGFWYCCTWPLGMALLWQWSTSVAIGHFILTHVLGLYSALRANSQIFGEVVQRFATSEREVWLTIDDGPFPGDTEAMLEVLARYDAQATFFLEGARVLAAPALASQILAAGHSLGNHSHHHRVSRFWAAPPWVARRELNGCTAALRETTGAAPVGFRPPVGMANGFVHRMAQRLDLPVIGWSVRGYDGVDPCPERVTSRILAQLAPGSILLLHQRPGREAGAPCNAATLERVLVALRENGYRCVLPAPHRFLVN